MNFKLIVKWGLFLFWIALIFLFSHQNGVHSTNSSSTFVKFFQDFFPFWKDSDFLLDFTFIVRKSAHFGEYFILGILTFSLLNEYYSKLSISFWYAFFFCLLYAISDEFHQFFIEGRSAKMMDVFVDCCGSFGGIFLSYFVRKKSKK